MNDKEKIVKLLLEAKTKRKSENRMIYFGKKLIDIPYLGNTLEIGDKEQLIVNIHELDCITFLENVIALSLCDKEEKRNFEDFCKILIKVRYRNGEIGDYTSRLHYFSWWAEDKEKMGIIKDVLSENESLTKENIFNINFMSNHPDYYKHLKNNPDFISVIKKYEEEINGKKYRYIPKENLSTKENDLLNIVHNGDIVAIVTNIKGLDIYHVGIIFLENGKIFLLHASSLKKRVLISEDSLYEYEINQPKHLGIRIFRLVDDEK